LTRKQVGINWHLLVEKDLNRMQSFYRLANLFTDVPHIKSRMKKRKWLVACVNRFIPFKNKYTFDYLYRITFFRSGDYLGMYIRLLVIGGLLIRSEEHTSELQSRFDLVCYLLLENIKWTR